MLGIIRSLCPTSHGPGRNEPKNKGNTWGRQSGAGTGNDRDLVTSLKPPNQAPAEAPSLDYPVRESAPFSLEPVGWTICVFLFHNGKSWNHPKVLAAAPEKRHQGFSCRSGQGIGTSAATRPREGTGLSVLNRSVPRGGPWPRIRGAAGGWRTCRIG